MPSPLRVKYNPRRPLKQTRIWDIREGTPELFLSVSLPLTVTGPYAYLFLEKVGEVGGRVSKLFCPKYFRGIHRISASLFKCAAPSSALHFLSSSPHSGRPLTSFHPILAFSCIHGDADGPTLLIDRSIHHSYPLSFLPSPSPCLGLATPFSVSYSELIRFR